MARAVGEASKTSPSPPPRRDTGACTCSGLCATVRGPQMEDAQTLPLSMPLPRPATGDSVRLRFGSSELVLECARGSHSLLWLDGREARRFALGLDRGGTLSLAQRTPRLPVRIAVRETITLAPGGRLRGYVQVPLVPTILWHPPAGAARVLIELPRRELIAEWDDRAGTVLRCTSSLHVRFPMRSAEPRATVAVRLANPTDLVASPAYLPMQLDDAELVERRGTVVALPRRLRWTGETFATAVRSHAEVMP